MAANNGDLARHLIDGGLAPQAARLIANALANAQTPFFSQGRDSTDSTPAHLLRMVTSDARRYQLTNLDYTPTKPFQERLYSTKGEYTEKDNDHPYKDSQPVVSAAPLSNPRVQGGDYISVNNAVDGNAEVSQITLKLRVQPGRHLRLDPSTKSLEGVPFVARAQGKFLTAEFQETEEGTELVISLRGLSQENVLLSNGDKRPAFLFPTTDAATGPASLSAGGTRALEEKEVLLANGDKQKILAWTTNTASAVTQPAGLCRALAVFDASKDDTGASSTSNTNRYILRQQKISSIQKVAGGRYLVTMSEALPDKHYVVLGVGDRGANNQSTLVFDNSYAHDADQFQVRFIDQAGATEDPIRGSIAVFY